MNWHETKNQHILKCGGYEVASISGWKDEGVQKYLVSFPLLCILRHREFEELEDAVEHAEGQLLKILHCLNKENLNDAFLAILPAEVEDELEVENRLAELLKDGYLLFESIQLSHPWFLMREGRPDSKEEIDKSRFEKLLNSGHLEQVNYNPITGRIWEYKESE